MPEWIKSCVDLEDHPKFIRFRKLMHTRGLRWSKNESIGFLHRFWHRVLRYAPSGVLVHAQADIPTLDPHDLPEMLGMPDDQVEAAMQCMIDAGFIERRDNGSLLIHDWLDYAGEFLRAVRYRHNPDKLNAVRRVHADVTTNAVTCHDTSRDITVLDKKRGDKTRKERNPLTPLPGKGDDVPPASPPAHPASQAIPAGSHSPPESTPTPQDESPPVPKRRTRQRSSGEDSVVAIPDKLNTPRFRKAWDDWLADRRDRRKPLTVRAQEIQLGKLARWGEQAAIASIERSIANGWQGLFEPQDMPRDSDDALDPLPTKEMTEEEIEAAAAMIKSWGLGKGGEAA